jgi:hypothetical protein
MVLLFSRHNKLPSGHAVDECLDQWKIPDQAILIEEISGYGSPSHARASTNV